MSDRAKTVPSIEFRQRALQANVALGCPFTVRQIDEMTVAECEAALDREAEQLRIPTT